MNLLNEFRKHKANTKLSLYMELILLTLFCI